MSEAVDDDLGLDCEIPDSLGPDPGRGERQLEAGLGIALGIGVVLVSPWCLLGALSLPVVKRAWYRLVSHPHEKALLANVALAEQGELDEAVRAQERRIVEARTPVFRIMALHDLGYFELLRGNHERALAIFWRVYRTEHLDTWFRAHIAGNFAMLYASLGDIDAADAWLAESDAFQLTPGPRAAVHTRAGRHDQTLALEWPRVHHSVRPFLGPDRRRFSLMQAFSHAQLHPTDRATLLAHLDRARPAYPDEHRRFATHWPELQAFLDAHPFDQLSAPETATLPRARVLPRYPPS